jgi:hypothetical protein
MGVIGYSGHVKVSPLSKGNSRGRERGRAIAVEAKCAACPGRSCTVYWTCLPDLLELKKNVGLHLALEKPG